MKLLKNVTFGLLALLVAVLVVATIVEKAAGTDVVFADIYGSWWFAMLWAVECVLALVYLIKCKVYKRPATMLLHLSFVVILAGALVTHVFGVQGTLHLRQGEKTNVFVNKETNGMEMFPFSVKLEDFQLQTYPGTMSAMDYVSQVEVNDGSKTEDMNISMNNIGEYNFYRFYQSGYDNDLQGAYLSIAYDPWGIGITYTGYALLVISMLLFLALPGEGFRCLLRDKSLRTATVLILFVLSMGASAEGRVLPKDVAQQFDSLYVYYNGRICPLQTVARDFTTKLCGKPTYKGYTAEQVFMGWMFYSTTWLDEPIIKIKGAHTKRILGTDAKYVSYADFFEYGNYRLDDVLAEIRSGQDVADARAITEADEKMNILRMHLNGQLMKIFPVSASQFVPDSLHPIDESLKNFKLKWYAPDDMLPGAIPNGQWYFIRHSLDYVNELSVMKDYKSLTATLDKIKKYQVKTAGAENLPSDFAFKSELLYNTIDFTRPLAMLLLTVGIVMFIVGLVLMIKQKQRPRWLSVAMLAVYSLSIIYLLFFISLRGIVSGHLPIANGYETMQFMSLCSLVITLCLWKKSKLIPSFGFIMAGLTLLVSMMGQSNPQITHLMPVLSSPLLSIHVCVIMIAYTLFAFIALNSIAGLIADRHSKDERKQMMAAQLVRNSRLMLYPAEFLLTAGIFIGAIWANVSWGRYWGWDPKEVWALITMLVYAFPLHGSLISWFRKPSHFNLYMLLAFISVIITYFGVNFFLGGMHSYANS